MDTHRSPRKRLDSQSASRRHPCAWSSRVPTRSVRDPNARSCTRSSARGLARGPSHAQRARSCVRAVGRRAAVCRTAEPVASATGPAGRILSCGGGRCGDARAQMAPSGPGTRVRPAARPASGARVSPPAGARPAGAVAQAANAPVATAAPNAPGVAGRLPGAVGVARAHAGEPVGWTQTRGARATATIRGWSTGPRATPAPRVRAGARTRGSPGATAARATPARAGPAWGGRGPRPPWRPAKRSVARRGPAWTVSRAARRRSRRVPRSAVRGRDRALARPPTPVNSCVTAGGSQPIRARSTRAARVTHGASAFPRGATRLRGGRRGARGAIAHLQNPPEQRCCSGLSAPVSAPKRRGNGARGRGRVGASRLGATFGTATPPA
jgi:hypothetical protein